MAEIDAAIDRLVLAGRAEFPDFDDRTTYVTTMAGKNFTALREAVAELPDGHRVIATLAADPDQAEQLLRMSPRKMAAALGRLATQKPAATVPARNKPPGPDFYDEQMPMKAWATEHARHRVRREAAAAPPANKNMFDPAIGGSDLDKHIDSVIANLGRRRKAR